MSKFNEKEIKKDQSGTNSDSGARSERKPSGRSNPKQRPVNRGNHNTRGNKPNGDSNSSVRARTFGNVNFERSVNGRLGVLSTFDTSVVAPERVLAAVDVVCTAGNWLSIDSATTSLFTVLRQVITAPTHYMAGDLMSLNVAMDNIAWVLAWCKFCIGMANTYDPINFTYPRAVLKAEGWDPDDLCEKLSYYVDAYNRRLHDAAKLFGPKLFSQTAFREHLFSKVFLDEDSPKAQAVIFRPAGFMKWDLSSGSSTAPKDLVWVARPTISNAGQMSTMLGDLIDAVLTDEDAMIMMGDIRKAWGENCGRIPDEPIDTSITSEIGVDPLINAMLHNAIIHEGIDLTQAPLTFTWVIPSGGTSPRIQQLVKLKSSINYGDTFLLDSPTTDVSDELLIYLCRWQSWGNNDPNRTTTGAVHIEGNGFEVLSSMMIYTYDAPTDSLTSMTFNSVAGASTNTRDAALALTPWANAPLAYFQKSSNNQRPIYEVYGPRTYYKLNDLPFVAKIHDIDSQIEYSVAL